MGGVRTLRAEDIPAVASLLQKTFGDARRPAPAALRTCLSSLLVDWPDASTGVVSRVYESDGRVAGFMGALPLRMRYRDEPILAAVPTALMVERPEENPLAGAQLVRSFLKGPQDISVSEPANGKALALWTPLGGESAVTESMEWLRVFRPAGLLAALAEARLPAPGAAKRLARLADGAALRFARGAFDPAPAPQRFAAIEADDEAMRAFLTGAGAGYALRPDWSAADFRFIVGHAAENASRGPLRRRLVVDRAGAPAGCFAYHVRPGGIGFVVQMAARADAAADVLDCLIADGCGAGAVALKGRTQARFLNALLARRCILFRRHTAMAHSRRPELMAAIRSGDALAGGFAGESWMRHMSDRFA